MPKLDSNQHSAFTHFRVFISASQIESAEAISAVALRGASRLRLFYAVESTNKRRIWRASAAVACVMLTASLSAQSSTRMVEAAAKPGHPWRACPTRTLADFPATATAQLNPPLTSYGGLAEHKVKATGFFHTTQLDGRWWLVDPEGGLFLDKAVVSVSPLRSTGARAAFAAKFGSVTNWAIETTAQFRTLGFNSLGAWSDVDTLAAVPQPLAYTRIWNFMSTYGRQRGGTSKQPGHTGYPNDCIFVFDPGFETFCDKHARQLADGKNDPHLLGHFSDNELPFKPGLLKNYLTLPAGEAGQGTALKWLQARHGPNAAVEAITPEDDRDFLEFVVARYFRMVSTAIKKYDPNHLFLGSRFHGKALAQPEIFRAAGPYVDVVSVNYYNAWTPDAARLALWEHEAHKPVLITEWYVKGADSGLGNTSGAGWLVKTQRERGEFYENFTLALLQSKVCVGWQWFRYIDNDPSGPISDPSNENSNKGLFNNRYVPYSPLLESMKRVNLRAYALVNYFDGKSTSQTGTAE